MNKETILIESKNAGWKFTCKGFKIDIETGLYFGMKNKYLENKNILITGLTNSNEQKVNWEISKIWRSKMLWFQSQIKTKLKIY